MRNREMMILVMTTAAITIFFWNLMGKGTQPVDVAPSEVARMAVSIKNMERTLHEIREAQMSQSGQKLIEKSDQPSTPYVKEEKPAVSNVKEKRAVSADADVDDKIHILFPSGCNAFQQWQAELLLHSHLKVGQKGKITRIVHGCENEHEEIKNAHHIVHPGGDLSKSAENIMEASTHPQFTLYRTPGVEGSKEFPYFNKPFSIDYFAKNGKGVWDPDDIIVVLDIDEVFITPVTQHPLPKSVLAYSGSQDESAITNVVSPGRPVGQMYGLGDPTFADLSTLCGRGSPCARNHDWEKYAVGPPLFVHMADLPALAELWHKYTRPIFEKRSEQLSEMYAYMAGAANLELKQVRLEQYMVTGGGVGHGEGWEQLDEWESMSCLKPEIPPGKRAPNFLHYCQTYAAQDKDDNRWLWHKGHVPASILDCDSPILKPPPDDLFNTQRSVKAKRNAWLICQMHYRVNEMLKDYKAKFCKPSDMNLKKQIRLVHGFTDGLPCGEKGCYPLAQTEDEDVLAKVPNDPNDRSIYTGND